MATRGVARSLPKGGGYIRNQDDRSKKVFIIKSRAGYQVSPALPSNMMPTLKEYPTVPSNSFGIAATKKPEEKPVVQTQASRPPSSLAEIKPPVAAPTNLKHQQTPHRDTQKRVVNIRRRDSITRPPPAARDSDDGRLQELMAKKRELQLLTASLNVQISDADSRNVDMSDVWCC